MTPPVRSVKNKVEDDGQEGQDLPEAAQNIFTHAVDDGGQERCRYGDADERTCAALQQSEGYACA